MSKIWKHSGLYDFLLPYVKAGIRSSYRRFNVTGADNVPSDGPVIYVANHSATLMDALVILYSSPRTVGFGARADIFRKPRTAAVLHWLKILPMARMRDGREAVASNTIVFSEVTECISKGVAFCLYPEGTHYPDAEVHPFKKGAARIAVESAQTLERTIYIVPVGLVYSNIFHFMADCSVNYGKPIEVNGDENINELTQMAREAVTELVQDNAMPDPAQNSRGPIHWLALLMPAPVLILCALAASPLLIAETLLIHRMKDKAWSNTVRFAVSLLFFPLWPFHRLFHLILNFYRK